VIVAAIAGGLIGYHSGESRADIVFEHGGKPPLQSRQKNNGAGREPAP
jgi:hypothetical protein